MSRFLNKKHQDLSPYTPGEQMNGSGWIKLNTNESPFPPPRQVVEAAEEAARSLQLYCDPDATELRKELARYLTDRELARCLTDREQTAVSADRIIITNGSDEILHFAFMAFCGEESPALFADITYGFYQVFADLEKCPSQIIPLKEDLSIDGRDYVDRKGTVFLANPNANTGIAMEPARIEEILRSDPDRVVVVDEAYGDFGAESVIPLVEKYDNLLVTRTFSKGWSMAGARLGYGVGSPDLIDDLNRIKYATDPYSVNAMTQKAGIAALHAAEEIRVNCETITGTRKWLSAELAKLNFELTPSSANFLFARHRDRSGKELYEKLKEKKILVRYFDKPRIQDHIRITVGSRRQMEILLDKLEEILEEKR